MENKYDVLIKWVALFSALAAILFMAWLLIFEKNISSLEAQTWAIGCIIIALTSVGIAIASSVPSRKKKIPVTVATACAVSEFQVPNSINHNANIIGDSNGVNQG